MSYETIREEPYGDAQLRLLQSKAGGYKGIVLKKGGGILGPFAGADAKDLWGCLQREALKAGRAYVGFDGARARFLHFFPNGFADARYLAKERQYKLKAKAQLDAVAPLDSAVSGTGFGAAALDAFRGTNLLIHETIDVPPLLRSPSADAFVRAAAAFTRGAGLSALQEMRGLAQPFDCAKWTVLTYLPFLWRPDVHMFLKPTITRDFAACVGHRFARDYASDLDITVYDSLLDLAARTRAELAPLAPRDGIDVQGFMWVVGAYDETDRT